MKQGKATILYVDDEEVNLFIFEKSFEKKFSILTTSSAKEALNLLDREDELIDVVISDMRMPVMNGVELITKAHESHPDKAYFILTGFEFNDEIEEAIQKNMIKKCFRKPFNIREIEASIEEEIKSTNEHI